MCSDKIHQGGGVAAPIASQVLGEALPYLDVIKKQEKQTNSVVMPNVIGMNLKEAKKTLNSIGLQYEIHSNSEEEINENPVILDQLPKQGITVQEETKIVLYTD